MENIRKQTENQETKKDLITYEASNNSNTKRKLLKEWGFEQAGLNRGDSTALESHLRWIKEGHLVDESYQEEEESTRKSNVLDQISEKDKDKTSKSQDIDYIQNVLIDDKENQKKLLLKDIEDKRIQLAKGMIDSNYSAPRFWLYTILAIAISFYLILFYASVINSSFFRDMQDVVDGGTASDVTLMLNSIFDVKGIFQWGPKLLFVYLGAFIFFGFGILPHIFHNEHSKNSKFKVVVATITCLIIDSLLAYKIDSGIHELKIMMGVADEGWVWYLSVNFYLVLAFGFGTYLLWGFLFEAALKESGKKNINAKVEIEIQGLKIKIRELEKEIIEQKETIKNMQKEIDSIKLEIENLKKQLEKASLKPEELRRNMEQFYSGWLTYLNASSENNLKKDSCCLIFNQFKNSLEISEAA
jgi:hypothetical protein